MKLKTIPEVKRQSLNIQAADVLRSQICNGNISPGTRFTEIAIATQMNLSRGTIRAALQQLATEGLVTQTPYTAWEVTSLDTQDIWELFTLRSCLEGLAARLAATAISPEGISLLDRAFAALEAACRSRNLVKVADADFSLHKVIISLSGHKRLLDQYRLVEFQVKMCIASSNELVPDIQNIVASHAPIVKAIKSGDADLAESLSKRFNIEHGKQLQEYIGKAKADIK
jgi:DNA-binding GntR family transcriptional regulator